MMRSIEVKLEYGSTAIVVLNLYTLFFFNCFRKQREDEKKTEFLVSIEIGFKIV